MSDIFKVNDKKRETPNNGRAFGRDKWRYMLMLFLDKRICPLTGTNMGDFLWSLTVRGGPGHGAMRQATA